MTDLRTETEQTVEHREPAEAHARLTHRRRFDPFVLWGGGAALALTASAVALSLVRNDGHFVYVIDDPAIHLSMADTLVRSGTWGVTEGAYESASSSPGWTLLIAATTGLLPRFDEWVPLLLNLAAAGLLLAALGRSQTLLRPGRRRLLDGVLVALIALAVLFLPGLAAVGMEHTLHAALVVVAVDLLTRRRAGHAGPRRRRLAYLALAAAALVRFETIFVAVGLGVGFVLHCIPRLSPDGRGRPLVPEVVKGVLCGVAVGVPVLAFGAVNLAMGSSFWPNTLLSKTALGGDVQALAEGLPGPYEVVRTIGTRDVVLLALLGLAAVVLIWAWYGGPRDHVLAATAFVITVLLHTLLAKYGYFDRYQAYLIAMGVYVALGWGSQVVRPAGRRPVLVAVLVLALLIAPFKLKLQTDIPLAMHNTYDQRYQAGLFLDRYYDGRAVSTSELGYVSLFHDGPVVDVLGLGSYDVMAARERHHEPAYWRTLMEENDVEVVAMYPGILREEQIPPEWELVGQWRSSGARVTGVWSDFEFWAPEPALVDPLHRNLEDFAAELPPNVETICVPCLKELAEDGAEVAGDGDGG